MMIDPGGDAPLNHCSHFGVRVINRGPWCHWRVASRCIVSISLYFHTSTASTALSPITQSLFGIMMEWICVDLIPFTNVLSMSHLSRMSIYRKNNVRSAVLKMGSEGFVLQPRCKSVGYPDRSQRYEGDYTSLDGENHRYNCLYTPEDEFCWRFQLAWTYLCGTLITISIGRSHSGANPNWIEVDDWLHANWSVSLSRPT